MYADFFGLREQPFNITPDPRFLFLNDCYQEAVAALTYGIQARKGFIALVGEAGTGKTTLLRHVLDSLEASTRSVLLLNPTVDFDEILEHILIELGVPVEGGGKLVRLQRLNEFLIEHTSAGGNVALMIDEAQDLRPDVLEELRLLSNLETAREKILQIVLAGQPELDGILANPALRQLRQRVTVRLRLRPLTPAEVATYVATRLERAGAARMDLFLPEACDRVAALSDGVPRLVNVLCDAALLLAFAAGESTVTPAIVDDAWRDFAADEPPAARALPPEAVVPPAEPAPPIPPPPAPPSAPPVATPPPAAPDVAPSPAVSTREADARVVAAPAPAVPPPAPVVVRPAPPAPPAVAPRRVTAGVAPQQPARPAPAPRSTPRTAARPSAPLGTFLVAGLAVGLVVVSHREPDLAPVEPVVAETPADDAPAAAAPALPVAAPADAVAAAPPAGARPIEGPVLALEATALVEQFRTAYESRDPERLVALFADDATENGRHGREAIAAAYRETLAAFGDVRYAVERVAVEPRGDRADVRAPFVIRYRRAGGEDGEIRGEAEWELERRGGRPLIVALSYRLDP
jgi:general secretion pathway protein A